MIKRVSTSFEDAQAKRTICWATEFLQEKISRFAALVFQYNGEKAQFIKLAVVTTVTIRLLKKFKYIFINRNLRSTKGLEEQKNKSLRNCSG